MMGFLPRVVTASFRCAWRTYVATVCWWESWEAAIEHQRALKGAQTVTYDYGDHS